MSTLKATNLQHASATSPNIVLGSDGSVAVGGGNISPQTGFKNRVINGDMRIDQRNAGASVTQTTGNVYGVDRFQSVGSVTSKFTFQQSSVAPAGFINSTLITSSAATTVGASEFYLFSQFIEGLNIADLGWGTANAASVTLSFWVRSSLTGNFGGVIQNSDSTRNYPFVFTISSANTFEYKTITIPGDTSGTWLTTNGTGMKVRFSMGAGATVSGASGVWSGTTYYSVTGATSVVGTNGATFYLTGVQVEKGSVATPFDFRSIGQELALCQRYFEKSYSAGTAIGTNTAVGFIAVGTPFSTVSNSVGYYIGSRFIVTKRATPSVTIYSRQGNAGRISTGLSHATELGANTAVGVDIGDAGFSILNNSGGTATISQNALAYHYAASAEL